MPEEPMDDYENPWVVVRADDRSLELRDEVDLLEAWVKSDGCIEFVSRPLVSLGPLLDHEQLHVCDIDDFILCMQALRDAAIAHFGEDWPIMSTRPPSRPAPPSGGQP